MICIQLEALFFTFVFFSFSVAILKIIGYFRFLCISMLNEEARWKDGWPVDPIMEMPSCMVGIVVATVAAWWMMDSLLSS
mmetsp:Transcript_10544/g.19214  ORF Transcript_10544/g.19214 Transcript_10544/m.19214 type:complete len:80 (-) Transcript_10544:1263-1502(-)